MRDGSVLLVASRYANHVSPLWNLPGGRARAGEGFGDALVREFREETGLDIDVLDLRYVSESLDGSTATRFINATFDVRVRAGTHAEPRAPNDDAHVVEVRWVPVDTAATLLGVEVVRVPLFGHLADPNRRYFSFAEAGITIEFSDPA